MHVHTEGQLEFVFSGATFSSRFDGSAHGLSHCMKAVDFVVDFPTFRLFVEVKDPDNTSATPVSRAAFAAQLMSQQFVDSLTRKYRDSWLYRWAEGHDSRPVYYVVLLQMSSLQPPLLLGLQDQLRRQLPEIGPVSWVRPLVDSVLILDIAAWNTLGTFGTVRRA